MLLDLDSNQFAKNFITIIYQDKDSRVSWYSDTSIEDIRFAVLCTCDSLVDGEFEILDEKAKVININKTSHFLNGSVYFLRKTSTNTPTNILLDGKRKLFVEIDPMQHIESQVAVKYMLVGSNLLKHTKKGFPHIRLFQLSVDFKRILWYTKSKKITEAQVSIDSIKEITIGQTSANFIRYPLKMLEDFSFTLTYLNKDNKLDELDLTCKDEREFDLWVIGLKALNAHYKDKIISKNELLSHSKSYKEQIDKGNISTCTKFLFYNKDGSSANKKSLDKFLVCRNMSTFELTRLFLKLCRRVKELRVEVEEESSVEKYDAGTNVEGYDMIFAEEAIVDDLDTQKGQMVNLFKQCETNLSVCAVDFLAYIRKNKHNPSLNIADDDADEFMKNIIEIQYHYETHLPNCQPNENKMTSEFFLKETDIQLWKIEVDLENVGDIIKRFKSQKTVSVFESMKNLFKF